MRGPGSIARNSALDLAGFTVPLLVGVAVMPVITRNWVRHASGFWA
jgi:hypothetical protein